MSFSGHGGCYEQGGEFLSMTSGDMTNVQRELIAPFNMDNRAAASGLRGLPQIFVISSCRGEDPAKFFQRFFQDKSNLRGYTEIGMKKCKPRKCN